MMYTFSKQDAQKHQEVTERLKAIFKGGSSVLKEGGAAGPNVVKHRPGLDGDRREIEKELEKQIAAMADANDEGHKISVFRDERGIVIRIMDRAFFDEGKAELKETAKSALRKIVPILEKSNNHVRIEGHTNNMPINTRGIQVQLGAFDEKGHGSGAPPDRNIRVPSQPDLRVGLRGIPAGRRK